ncbi:acetyl-CoA carboxylase family protein [Zhongshania aquimaris]|uniref:acetyl-CoA carboxylase n=1 Tax=Zhongshania aquimaris TaxID=2857107 RepID=A0ABS6VWQ8_9GAMM|nr:carboxyl transferase domain-containing protein [Zhongshania aquimaris]MBW2942763.1 carbamoyl-phosphate synthase large subunit [Zhongshania aquimaris]
MFSSISVFKKLLIANRGEVAVRIARSAQDIGLACVAVYSEDDEHSGHLRYADSVHPLRGSGAAAYLDTDQLISAAQERGCDAVHPGYGFLSENAEFARRCQQAGLVFIGPSPENIALFGDKTRAIDLAVQCGVAVNKSTTGALTLDQAKSFFVSLGAGEAMIIKARAGGGGKGMRVVSHLDELAQAFAHCQSEAIKAFASDALYAERLIRRARHIEVQIIGDGQEVSHLWERECTLQRQHQKLVEIAPSPSLSEEQRNTVIHSAMLMAQKAGYSNIGTFEFLIDLDREGQPDEILFLEVNPRLQVEHTVTEEVLGLDLLHIQLALAAGAKLAELNLNQDSIPAPRGCAVQLRINMETMDEQGRALPSGGFLERFVAPTGPGIRVDTFAYSGYRTVASFDSLLAKLIVSSPGGDYSALLKRAGRALKEFDIEGVSTNIAFLNKLLSHPAVLANTISTRFVEEYISDLYVAVDKQDKLQQALYDDDVVALVAPLYGVVSALNIAVGDYVQQGAELLCIEAMKLEHVIHAPSNGFVQDVFCRVGDSLQEGDVIVVLQHADDKSVQANANTEMDLALIREDLQLLRERHAETLDEQRPTAVARRRSRGQRTARENIADLCDDGSFIEYGQLTVAYLHARKSDEELRATTPADGFVMGIATVNADLFGEQAAQVAVGSYDATVMAGTQGHKNHQKTDRLFDLAKDHKIPLLLFAEGGGGRPREDPVTIAALQNENFRKLAELSGLVPVVGVVSGRCFAGNAALLGMADVIIATENSNIGMAGPALIEAGGLGVFSPEQVGPIAVQHDNGVVDIRVKDEAEAVATSKKYLGYFQGNIETWRATDARRLRHIIPENRLRAYDVRDVINELADIDSVLELRSAFGKAYVTALARIEGRAVGVIANNPKFNSGAIDSDSADKASRFMRLCDAHGLAILSLIDTPGIMVGPEAEQTALVRHSARMFVTAASLQVPIFAIVLRKAYGLGAMAAAGGHFRAPFFTIAWPTGELGGMGLEGGVRLAYKNELAAIEDENERQAFFEERVASRYRKGKASYIASYFELDAVIDPADSRQWIVRGLMAAAESLKTRSRRFIDSW